MEIPHLLIIAVISSEPYADLIITIIAISYIFKLIITFTKNNDRE